MTFGLLMCKFRAHKPKTPSLRLVIWVCCAHQIIRIRQKILLILFVKRDTQPVVISRVRENFIISHWCPELCEA